MYCVNCGNKVDNISDNFCSNCGNRLNNIDTSNSLSVSSNNNWMKVVSIVLGSISIFGLFLIILAPVTLIFTPITFITSLVGLIFGFISLKSGKNLLGMLFCSISFVVSLVINILLLLFFITFARDIFSYGDNWYNDINDNYNGNSYSEHYKGSDF